MIYVASSWRNDSYETFLDCLVQNAIDHYNFKADGFHWSDVWPAYHSTGVSARELIVGLEHPTAEKHFKKDMDALVEATACILILPCGRSAHTELGYAVGADKPTCVYFPSSYRADVEPELMYSMCSMVTDEIQEAINFCRKAENDQLRKVTA